MSQTPRVAKRPQVRRGSASGATRTATCARLQANAEERAARARGEDFGAEVPQDATAMDLLPAAQRGLEEAPADDDHMTVGGCAFAERCCLRAYNAAGRLRAGARSGVPAVMLPRTPIDRVPDVAMVEAQSAARCMLHAVSNALQSTVLRRTSVQDVLRRAAVAHDADGWYVSLDLHRALRSISGDALGPREGLPHLGATRSCSWWHTLTLQAGDMARSDFAGLVLRRSIALDAHSCCCGRESGWHVVDA